MLLRTLCLSLLLNSIRAVNRNDFKTCDQAAFCKRHRSITENTGYEVDFSTVKHSGSVLTAEVTNPDNKLVLKLTGLSDSRVRIQIDEPENALRKRFVPELALDGAPKELAFESVDVQTNVLKVVGAEKKVKVMIHRKPFLVDIYNELDELVSQVNAAGKLKVEEYRTKEEGKEYPEGFWEESFKSFTDSKPFGSSSIGVDISFVGFRHAYGLPEHADAFSLKSTVGNTDPYRLYNLDVFEYELHNPMALYVAVPYMVAHKKNRTTGVLWLNAAETWIDTLSSEDSKGMLSSMLNKVMPDESQPRFDAHFISETGIVDLFFFMGPTPQEVQKQYALTTGTTPLPPLFSIAYHQCRWNYNDEQDVAEVNAGFDDYDIPMDVLWLDIEHTDGKRYFTWDSNKFGHPKEMINNVASKGRKIVTIIDPHIKKDDSYKVYKDAKDLGLYVKKADGVTDFEGHCWPGGSEYLDFLHPETRKYWAAQFAFDRYEGSTKDLFTWNDMNEPSVFSGPEITMDKDSLHYGGIEHREVHNMYGFFHHSNTFQGQLDRTGGRDRPFILTRSGFIGTQRTAAIWTGDNMAEWGHLEMSVPMLLSLSSMSKRGLPLKTTIVCGIDCLPSKREAVIEVSGVPFVGADVGGFFGNPDEQLLVRWYQAGSFQPFFRAHAHIETRRREPWLFSEPTRLAIRDAVRQRYALLPYWYLLFRQHASNGLPPMRPIFYEFPTEEELFAEEKAWMVGNALLVRSVLEKDTTSISVVLPAGEKKDTLWYEWESGVQKLAGTNYVDAPLTKTPVWQRGGTIVPTWQRIRRASSLMREDPLTLFVALDSARSARGEVYLDDGETHDYKTNHKYTLGGFEYITKSASEAVFIGRNADNEGVYQAQNWIERIEVRGVSTEPSAISLDGKYSLRYSYDRDHKTLSIRKPETRVGSEFKITIAF